ncbi:hypothetical protein [Lentibacillus sediminis]|uniref:hypothetical protein n=1 Tax=Lentibacillus sediminis TaxID=1940529 RepID=UPI0013046C8A|nr:hypothetical protein [Lentibacillus sediminis]
MIRTVGIYIYAGMLVIGMLAKLRLAKKRVQTGHEQTAEEFIWTLFTRKNTS